MLKRVAVEFGMGTDLRGEDYTKAACRAVEDAVRHNALTIGPALGLRPEAMIIDVQVGVARPQEVDVARVADVLPYGKIAVEAVEGGLDIAKPDGGRTLMANAAVIVSFDLQEEVSR